MKLEIKTRRLMQQGPGGLATTALPLVHVQVNVKLRIPALIFFQVIHAL